MSRSLYRYGVPQGVRAPAFQAIRAARSMVPMKRALPTYLLLGGQRCGTTSLQQRLVEHPGICGSFRKEVGFFDSNWDRGLGWYRAHFPTEASLRRLGKRLGYPPAVGEATVYYLFHPLAPSRAKTALPDAKLIALLRNPTERAYSSYKLQVALGTEDLSFAEAIEREEARLAGTEGALAQGRIQRSREHRAYSYVARGLYARQLARWREQFPETQLLVVASEDLFQRPDETLRLIYGFIGVPDVPGRGFGRAQNALAGGGDSMPGETRARLDELFRGPNEELYEMLGRDLGWNAASAPASGAPRTAP